MGVRRLAVANGPNIFFKCFLLYNKSAENLQEIEAVAFEHMAQYGIPQVTSIITQEWRDTTAQYNYVTGTLQIFIIILHVT